MKPKTKADIARKYRDEYGMEMSIRQLSKIMFQKEYLTFKNEEDARMALRRIEGKAGGDSVKVTHPYPPREKSAYSIPQPDGKDLEPFILPTHFNDFIFASDFHVPNHRTEPIKAMIRYAKANGVKRLMIGGDLLDNTPFTRWLHEPVSPSDVPRWFDMAKELLRYFKSEFDDVYWIEGNHDFWFKRFLMEKAPILFGDSYFHLEERLQLNDIGVKFIDQRFLVKAGKLNIHHGHLTFRGGGGYANAARMLYMKTKSNMICGHVHVESSHTEPDIDDTIATTFTVGCMCTLRPDYQPFGGKACHGFAHIKVHANRNFSVKNLRIYNGEIL